MPPLPHGAKSQPGSDHSKHGATMKMEVNLPDHQHRLRALAHASPALTARCWIIGKLFKCLKAQLSPHAQPEAGRYCLLAQ